MIATKDPDKRRGQCKKFSATKSNHDVKGRKKRSGFQAGLSYSWRLCFLDICQPGKGGEKKTIMPENEQWKKNEKKVPIDRWSGHPASNRGTQLA